MREMACVNGLASRNSRHWIGLKRESSNTWRWLDGTQMTFRWVQETRPVVSQIMQIGENCVEAIDGLWNDLKCEFQLRYICKRSLSC
ncbi:hypothetical protein XELAEV_18018908mg [Xenopus laevis]|uniref:C-type lectin domain-containing protein n=1 Tax=Xenopus laevis TaxID=8355 RepID=A0A974DF27_XENLA|nr:hypothetical protein XELAEV_18018908mg [Xenopus laevis]